MTDKQLRIRIQVPANFSASTPERHIETIYTSIDELLERGAPFMVTHTMTTMLSCSRAVGQKDSEGTDIYEDDIVDWEVPTIFKEDRGHHMVGAVKYWPSKAKWYFGDIEFASKGQSLTILGNTFDNPELLQ